MDDDYTEETAEHERAVFGRPYVGPEDGPDRCDVTFEPTWMCECSSCKEDRACAQAEQVWESETGR